MINLLLVSPQSKQSQGGMTVWTDMFLTHCAGNGIACDLLNIATIGSRALKGNSKRNYRDEFVRTKAIFVNLKQKLSVQEYHAAHLNTSCGAFGLIRDYLIVKQIKKKQPHCRCIVHFHCDVENQTQIRYKRFFLKKILEATDEVLTLNEKNRQFLGQVCTKKITVVPNFVDRSIIRNQEKPISEDIHKAVFVGYVQPRKGAQEIYELAKKYENITFELFGEVRGDVKEWDKPGNVVLHGPKSRCDIFNALDESDIFLFPTYSEGFSIALLESMARGLPCITTSVGANAEMIEGKGGIIVSVGDKVAMELAIESLRDPQKRKEMSKWNVQKVCAAYTVQTVMEKIFNVYISKTSSEYDSEINKRNS